MSLDPRHLEYSIHSGVMQIMADVGAPFGAFGAYPQIGAKYPCVVVLHDWWGIIPPIRRLVERLAEMGYYVLAPDLFDGETASQPSEAIQLMKKLPEAEGLRRVKTALDLAENHTRSNHYVCALGVGMGGAFALEMAVQRPDLEAAVVYSAFPQSHLGRLAQAKSAIMAVYGADDKIVPTASVAQFKKELESFQDERHAFHSIEGLEHDFFASGLASLQTEKARYVHRLTEAFLYKHLVQASKKGR